ADEPTGNLDPGLTQEIMSLLSDANVRGTTVVVATHDLTMVERLQKRVVRLEKGRIVSDGGGPATVRRVGYGGVTAERGREGAAFLAFGDGGHPAPALRPHRLHHHPGHRPLHARAGALGGARAGPSCGKPRGRGPGHGVSGSARVARGPRGGRERAPGSGDGGGGGEPARGHGAAGARARSGCRV